VVRRKGELSPAAADRGWPHQVVLPELQAVGWRHRFIHDFCRDLSLCPRGHAVFHDNQWWCVFGFADQEHAEKFAQRFGGERFDPKQKGSGRQWAQWRR